MSQESYNGRYFRTCQNDIKSSQGWFGKICLLGLISFIPVFGQMTLYGYAYEWAHQAAWGVKAPMPKKIYGRPGSKMLRWGWFALVIAFVFALIPGLVNGLGSFLSAAGAPTTVVSGHHVMSSGGNVVLSGFGWIISFIGSIGMIVAGVLAWVGTIRMTMYDRLGTGFQFGKIFAMARKDWKGLVRIFAMNLLVSLIAGIILVVVGAVIIGIIVGATVMPLIVAAGSSTMSESAAIGYIFSGLLVAFPVLLIFMYIAFVVEAWIQLLVARAIGYWCQQFNVAEWGTKDDPLPFEAAQAQQPTAAPVPPVAGTPGPAPAPAAEVDSTQPAAPDPTAVVEEVVEEAPAPDPATIVEVEAAEAQEVSAEDTMTALEVEEIIDESSDNPSE